MPTIDLLETVVRELDGGRRAALCVVVATRGSAPQVPGAMLCVDETGQITGTVGGGCVEAEIRRRAHQLLSTSRGGVFTFDMDHDFGFDDGAICGGAMDVAISVFSGRDHVQPVQEAVDRLRAGRPATLPIHVATSSGPVDYRLNLESPPKLVIAGAGHVGQALAAIMPPLGFRVSVVDDRSEFAGAERFPSPVEAVVGDISKTLADWPIDANTYIVIVTRGHEHDERALGAVLDSAAKYIGMIGSRRKIKIIFDNLKRAGAKQEWLDRVHSPIGLGIRAVTPEEIAVSIAAELISVRRAEYRKTVEGPISLADDAT